MQALSNMGLVAISHGERAKVLQLTAKSIIKQVDGAAKIMLSSSKDTLEHLKTARIFFERGMVREAAEKRHRRGCRSGCGPPLPNSAAFAATPRPSSLPT